VSVVRLPDSDQGHSVGLAIVCRAAALEEYLMAGAADQQYSLGSLSGMAVMSSIPNALAEFKKLTLIGQGSFADVCKAVYLGTN